MSHASSHSSLPLTFSSIQRAALYVGLVGLVVGCFMTYKFGAGMSALHAIMLLLISVLAAIILPARRYLAQYGADAGMLRGMRAAAYLFIGIELFSHFGYTVGMREWSAQTAGVQTVNWQTSQDTLQEQRINVGEWRKKKATLDDERRAMGSELSWLPTVTADGLKADLVVFDKDIELETARGGCKSKCRALMAKRAELEKRIELASAFKSKADEIAKLDERIEATQRLIDKGTTETRSISKGFSLSDAQAGVAAKAWTMVAAAWDGKAGEEAMKPTAVTMEISDYLLGVLLAIGTTGLPVTAFQIAFFGFAAPPRRALVECAQAGSDVGAAPVSDVSLPVTVTVPVPVHVQSQVETQAIEVASPNDIPRPPLRGRVIGAVRTSSFAQRVAGLSLPH